MVILVFVRQGTTKSQISYVLRPRQTDKIDCKARVNAILNKDDGYTLSSVILDHTHTCSSRKARHLRQEYVCKIISSLLLHTSTYI